MASTGKPTGAPSGASITAFMAKLLAPLPANEERVDSPAFRKLLKKDAAWAWRDAMNRVKIARAAQVVASSQIKGVDDHAGHLACHQAFKERVATETAQCLIPAPGEAEVRWKMRTLRQLGRYATPAAIAAAESDRLRLLGGQ